MKPKKCEICGKAVIDAYRNGYISRVELTKSAWGDYILEPHYCRTIGGKNE